MYVVVVSLADPVSRTFLELTKPTPKETRGGVEIMKWGDISVVVHPGEPTEFNREDILAELGRWAIFISRHEMANPKPMFTVHTPGSWPDVSIANPALVSALYRAMCKLAEEPYSCAIEATHHPPNTAKVSATFAEVGSTEREWLDKRAVSTLVQAVGEILGGFRQDGFPTMIVGDLHYCTLAQNVLGGEIDVGHIIPKYVTVTEEVVKNALFKHTVDVKRAIIFRKNAKNPTRDSVVKFLKAQGIEVVLKG